MIEAQRKIIEFVNQEPGTLKGLDCPLCLNRGYFVRIKDDGTRHIDECSCMAKRRSLKRIEKSGLSELLESYTLDRWVTKEAWQKTLSEMVKRYAENPKGWFFIAGRPGTGKTHLCTALSGILLNKGMETRYVLWRDLSVQAKAVVNREEEYHKIVEPLKRVRVLYLDDFFKTGKGQEPTIGDVNLAFEILNNRYNDEKLITIISSEWTAKQIIDIDEAVGSRIYERSKGNYADLSDRENWRLKK